MQSATGSPRPSEWAERVDVVLDGGGWVVRLRALVLALAVSVTPLAAGAQARAPYRIGFLLPSFAGSAHAPEDFRQGLRDLGYVEGQNITVEYRYANGRPELLQALASEFVTKKVDVIVTVGSGVAVARNATATIPIVMRSTQDPVAAGFVASLARPGGNVTGVTSISSELQQKRLELLAQLGARVSAVGILWNGKDRESRRLVGEMEDAVRALGLRAVLLDVQAAGLEGAIRKASHEKAALVTVRDPLIVSLLPKIVTLAGTHRVPAIYDDRELVDTGGLMSYGANLDDLHRRLALYVDKILRGAKPADLPVEQPTTFELAINLKTARALGLTIPPALLARADRIVE
jgi:putative ABC transport system substrate-binding protein